MCTDDFLAVLKRTMAGDHLTGLVSIVHRVRKAALIRSVAITVKFLCHCRHSFAVRGIAAWLVCS